MGRVREKGVAYIQLGKRGSWDSLAWSVVRGHLLRGLC